MPSNKIEWGRNRLLIEVTRLESELKQARDEVEKQKTLKGYYKQSHDHWKEIEASNKRLESKVRTLVEAISEHMPCDRCSAALDAVEEK